MSTGISDPAVQSVLDGIEWYQKHVDELELQLQSARDDLRAANSSAEFWHEKYVDAEESVLRINYDNLKTSWRRINLQLMDEAHRSYELRQENERLVDELNKISDIINAAAKRQEETA